MNRIPRWLAAFGAALALGLLAPAPRAGQVLFASDAAEQGMFGYHFCQQDDTLVVGAPYASPLGKSEAGAAYVFVRGAGGWTQQALLLDAQPAILDAFGAAVALDRDTVLVGAGDDAVHVFVRRGTTWNEQATLVAPPGLAYSAFGWAVALERDTAFVGAQYLTLPGQPYLSGAVFVFRRTGESWSRVEMLRSPTPQEQEQFGSYLALDRDTLMIATGGYSPALPMRLYVYVRHGMSWSFEQQLDPPVAETGTFSFSSALALHGDTAMVSADHVSTAKLVDNGVVLVYQRSGSTWAHQDTLAVFADSVAFRGERAVFGESQWGPGSAYVFGYTGATWTQLDKLESLSSYGAAHFGQVVALSDDEIFVGAPNDKAAGPPDSGSVFVQTFAETLQPWADIGFALPGKSGAPYLAATGTLEAGSPADFSLENAHHNATALLMVSPSAALTPFKSGTLVPGPSLLVVPGKTSKKGELVVSTPAWPAGLPSGFTFYLQFAVEDSEAKFGVALSNALLATTP